MTPKVQAEMWANDVFLIFAEEAADWPPSTHSLVVERSVRLMRQLEKATYPESLEEKMVASAIQHYARRFDKHVAKLWAERTSTSLQ